MQMYSEKTKLKIKIKIKNSLIKINWYARICLCFKDSRFTESV
jgi:hypothetical protein